MFESFKEIQLLRKQQNLTISELNRNFSTVKETMKQIREISRLNSYEDTINNFKAAKETMRQIREISRLNSYEDIVNNFKAVKETIRQWQEISRLNPYNEMVNNFKTSIKTTKQWREIDELNSYKEITNNLMIMKVGIKQWNEVTSSFQNEKYLKITKELEDVSTVFDNKKIVININLLSLTKMLDSIDKILKLLISLKESKLKFLILCLCLCLGSLKSSIIEKISDQIISKTKIEIKKIAKEYKRNNVKTFLNLGIVVKNNTILYEAGKGEKITTIEYGQVIEYEKIKGKFIIVRYTKNGETYEGVILKKYLKKLD